MIDPWQYELKFTHFPPWPCPACGGSLNYKSTSVKRWPAKAVALGIDEGHLFHWDEYGVFSVTLNCSNYACSQGVAVLGDYSTDLIDQGSMATECTYTVRAIHPAPSLIAIPEVTPDSIAAALRRSFALYWSDPEACAVAIRIAIEGVAEHLGEIRIVSGKFVSLEARLSRIQPKHPEVVEAFRAIKDIGNDGAHGDKVDRGKLLAAYELIEIELRRLFNNDDQRRQELINNLRAPSK